MEAAKFKFLSGLTRYLRSSNMHRFYPLWILTALALLLRLINLDISFWYDEGFTGHLARQSPAELLRFLSEEDIHPPLYFLAIRAWATVFPTDLGIRYFSVLTGVISVPILFSLCAKMFNRGVGWIASAFLVVSPFHLKYSQEARQYSFYILLTIAACWFLVTALESARPWNPWWPGYLFIVALIPYTHGGGPLIVMGLAAFHLCLIWRPDRVHVFQWMALYSLALLLFLPWAPSALHHANMATSGWAKYIWLPPVSPSQTLSAMQWYIYYPPYHRAGSVVYTLWITPYLFLLASAALLTEPSRRRHIIALIALAAVPVAAISIYGYLRHNIFVTRVLAPVVIPLLILAALPINSPRKSPWRPALVITTIFALLVSLASSLSYLHHRRGTAWREAVAEVRRNIRADDAILVLPEKARYVFNWYFQQDNDRQEVTSITDVEELASNSLQLFKDHPRLWIVRDTVVRAARTKKVIDWFAEQYPVQRVNRFEQPAVFLVVPENTHNM